LSDLRALSLIATSTIHLVGFFFLDLPEKFLCGCFVNFQCDLLWIVWILLWVVDVGDGWVMGLWVANGGWSIIVGFVVACVANGGEMIWVLLEGFAVIVCWIVVKKWVCSWLSWVVGLPWVVGFCLVFG
jgi:hypothetical protein